MLSVYVLRHGKSDWDALYDQDHERPLARRGKRAARRMGRFLARRGEAPELVLCSSAKRARRTAELAIEAGAWPSRLHVDSDLYEASSSALAEYLREQVRGPRRVMLVGHNPSCAAFVGEMTSSAAPAFPTAALARIDFAAESWSHLEGGSGELRWLLTPRQVRALERG